MEQKDYNSIHQHIAYQPAPKDAG